MGCSDKDSDDVKTDSNKEETGKDYTFINSQVAFGIRDKEGNDLLNPQTSGYYAYEDIDVIYYDAEGNMKVYENPLLDASKGFFIRFDHNGGHICLMLSEPESGSEKSKTHVRFGSKNETDTFEAEFDTTSPAFPEDIDTGGSYVDILKVWHNGTLLYDKAQPSIESLIIIKEPKR
jgi:hypothetical protein